MMWCWFSSLTKRSPACLDLPYTCGGFVVSTDSLNARSAFSGNRSSVDRCTMVAPTLLLAMARLRAPRALTL